MASVKAKNNAWNAARPSARAWAASAGDFGTSERAGGGITQQGLAEALAGLEGMAANAEDLTPIFAAIAPVLHEATIARFTVSGAPASWPILKHPHPGPMLVGKTKALRDGIGEKASKDKLVQKAAARYGWYQQVGSKAGRKYVTLSQAAQMQGEGAQFVAGKKGRQARVEIVGSGGRYAVVSKRGQWYVDADGNRHARKGRKSQGRKLVQARERSGRGGIDPRAFLFLVPKQTEMVFESIQQYVMQPTQEGNHASG